MRRLTRRIWDYLTCNTAQNHANGHKAGRARLELEYLESRSLLSANFSGSIAGVTFLDADHNGVRDSGDLIMGGVVVTLTGTTTQNVAVKVTQSTAADGSFDFLNVLPGTYQLKAGPVSGLINSTDVASSKTITLGNGQALHDDLAFSGQLNPAAISIAEFLTTSNGVSAPFGADGAGSANVNYRPDNKPVVSTAIATQAITENSAPTIIDLAGHFSDPDTTNSLITFNITDVNKTLGIQKVTIQMQLLDKQAPQTVANFFDYIQAHAYDNSIFHRLETGTGLKVLQGGAITVTGTGNGFATIPILTQGTGVPNEFLAANSNIFGTIAMAQSGNPNSGTDQFFFNTGNNASALDSQKFAVFGRVVASSDSALTALTKTPVPNITIPQSVLNAFPTVAFNSPGSTTSVVPLNGYSGTGANFPTDATRNNFLTINSITVNKHDEFLTYSATSDNTSLVTPSIKNEWLTLNYATGKTGTANITVTATDRYGATVTQTFKVTVGNPPVISNVTIAADNASNVTKLTATPTATDPQGLPITFTYQWFRNGTAITGQTGQTLLMSAVSSVLTKGDTITCKVTPHDSVPFDGAQVTSNTLTIQSLNPIVVA